MTSTAHSASEHLPLSALPQNLNQPGSLIQPNHVLQALRQWHREGGAQSPLAGLHLFQTTQRRDSGTHRHTANTILCQALAQLATENAEYEKLLNSRFLDGKTVYEVANDLNIAESTLHTKQKAAVSQLTHIILEMEDTERTERSSSLIQALGGQSDGNLIGIAPHLDALAAKLAAVDGPLIIAIEGIGGIGKTTLADELVRRAIYQDLSWERVGWVTARQNELKMSGVIGTVADPALTAEALIEQLYDQLLPDSQRPPTFDSKQMLAALEKQMADHKCLVVIDNLETIEDVESLLPTLRLLSSPSKFILTSRKSFYAARDLFHFQVPELDEVESLELVRREAEASNLPHVAEASDEELRPIYETVGGNPLALRLVTGQLHVHGLGEILEDLTEARTETAENLYLYIYRRAWEHLCESARRALIAMILVTDYGDTIDELLATCNLDRSDLRRALKQLVTLNLVESRGGLNERRYSIHNLTRSFLHKQVVMWG